VKTDWEKVLTETFSEIGGKYPFDRRSKQNLGDIKLKISAPQGDRFLVCLYILAFSVVPRLVSIEVLMPK